MSSLKPYLVRAIYQWIVDNHLTPYLLVDAEVEGVVVPRAFVQEGRIVLNLRPEAIHELALGDEHIAFNARFGGKPMQVYVPIRAALALYAQENGKGMVFDEAEDESSTPPPPPPPEAKSATPGRKRPELKVVK